MGSLQRLDYIAIGLYLVLMAGIGLFFKWFVKDINSYVKGSGAIPWVVASISNFMGLFSTFVFVAYAGIAYEDGIVSVTVFWCTVTPCVIAALFFAKRWRRSGILTPIEYLETRYNPAVRQTIGWIGIFMRVLDNTVRLYALGLFLTAVTPWSLPVCMIASSIIVVAFSLYGGLWAVSLMGTIQFVILIFVSLILFWLSLDHIGGFSGIQEKIPDHLNWFNGPKGNFFWLIIYYIMVIIKYNENWTMIQRFYSVRDEKAAQKVGYFTAFLFFIVPVFFMIPPIVARIVMPDLPDKEMAYAAISKLFLPPGLMGVMVASMFAATMSTLNAEYNVIASVLSKDVYQRLINSKVPEKQLLLIAKISTILVGLVVLIGALFVTDFGGAFEANKLFTGIFAIPLGIPLVLGLINRKATSGGAMQTILIGALTGIILNSFPRVFSWELSTAIEIIVCISIYYLSSALNKRKPPYSQSVSELFERIKTPIPLNEKPEIDKNFSNALRYLYVCSFSLTALLFIIMGIISINELSGALSVAAGFLCIFIGVLIWVFKKKK
jgi:SSS family transporter